MLQSTPVVVLALLALGSAQSPPEGYTSVPQCRCSDIEVCSQEINAKTETCKIKFEEKITLSKQRHFSAQCTAILAKIGDSNKIRQCLDKDQAEMMKLEACAKKKLNGELGCTNAAAPKNLTIPLIPVVEVPSLDSKDAPQAAIPQAAPQGPPELTQYLMCVDQCSMADMEVIPGRRKKRSPVACAFKLKCALAPPDAKIQDAYTQCEKELSMNAQQRLTTSCNCLKSAGVTVDC